LFIELQSDFEHHLGRAAQAFERDFWICQTRVLSFAMVVGIGFVLMVSLVVSAALTALGKNFSSLVPGLGVISVVSISSFHFW